MQIEEKQEEIHNKSILDISQHDLGNVNVTTIQGAATVEDHPKYMALVEQLREREQESDRLRTYSVDLETKIQRMLQDFQLFRNKAQ